MKDMGKKQDTGEVAVAPESKSRVSYPTFSLSGDRIPPELADAKVGDTCELNIIVKKVADSIDTYGDGEPRIEVEIRKLEYESGKVSADEYKNMTSDEKDKADAADVLGDE